MGEGGYLDIKVNWVVDIKKVWMNVRIISMEKVKCGCCHIRVVLQSKGHPTGQLHLLGDSLGCEE